MQRVTTVNHEGNSAATALLTGRRASATSIIIDCGFLRTGIWHRKKEITFGHDVTEWLPKTFTCFWITIGESEEWIQEGSIYSTVYPAQSEWPLPRFQVLCDSQQRKGSIL
jgi:hypothetical protein